MDDIGVTCSTLRAHRDLIVSVQACSNRARYDVLQRLCSFRRIVDGRQSSRSLRETNPVFRYRRIIADRYAFAVLEAVPLDAEVCKRVIRIGVHIESDLINGSTSVFRRHGDTGFSVHVGRHGDCYLLELIRRYGFYRRHGSCSHRQRVRVGGLFRTEIRNEHAVNLDSCQGRVLGFLGTEDQFVHAHVSVSGSNRHAHRSVYHSFAQLRDCYRLVLIAFVIADGRDRGGTHRHIDIIDKVIRLKRSDIIPYLQVLEV